MESAELQLSPLERKLGEVAPRGPSKEAFGVLWKQMNIIGTHLEFTTLLVYNTRERAPSMGTTGAAKRTLSRGNDAYWTFSWNGSKRSPTILHAIPSHTASAKSLRTNVMVTIIRL